MNELPFNYFILHVHFVCICELEQVLCRLYGRPVSQDQDNIFPNGFGCSSKQQLMRPYFDLMRFW